MACPACGRAEQPVLKVKCDACGACFCGNGNCTGTLGHLKRTASGRSVGATCPTCTKGKLKKL